ncbi:hypothetical protein P885DRAFT_7981, partial [Corynascus similis CBS 632.67]
VGDDSKKLHNANERAILHAICTGVGIGGHAIRKGLGPTSRMWGFTLGYAIEVEVATANVEIRQANNAHNADLFW